MGPRPRAPGPRGLRARPCRRRPRGGAGVARRTRRGRSDHGGHAEREERDAGQDEPVAVDAVVDRRRRVGDPDGAEPPARRDRNGDVEQIRAERPRRPRAGGDAAAERLANLGLARRSSRRPCRAGWCRRPRCPCVDHDDVTAGVGAVAVGDGREAAERGGVSPSQLVLHERRDRGRVAFDPGSRAGCARCGRSGPRAGSRGGQHDDHEREVAEQQAPAHGEQAKADAAQRLDPGRWSPSLRRSDATWTSIVFVDPYQFVCHTSSRSRRRLTAAPASRRAREQVELLGRELDLAAVHVTRRARVSHLECADAQRRVGRRSCVRRVTARIRATTSRKPNGLTM